MIFSIIIGLSISKISRIICLVKPQFEAGRDQVGKKGIVKEVFMKGNYGHAVGRMIQGSLEPS